MKSFVRALVAPGLLVCAAVAQAQAPQAAPLKIVYVNPGALFQAAPGRAEAASQYEKETMAYRAELTKMSDALTAMVSDYQKKEATLTQPDKDKRQAQIQAKEDSLRQRQSELEQAANERQQQLMAPIMETVRKVLEDIRVEDGITYILSSEPQSSPILAADKNLDYTDRVVARLKTMAATASKAPVAPATKAPVPATTPATKTGAPAAAPSGVTRPKPPGV